MLIFQGVVVGGFVLQLQGSGQYRPQQFQHVAFTCLFEARAKFVGSPRVEDDLEAIKVKHFFFGGG